MYKINNKKIYMFKKLHYFEIRMKYNHILLIAQMYIKKVEFMYILILYRWKGIKKGIILLSFIYLQEWVEI